MMTCKDEELIAVARDLYALARAERCEAALKVDQDGGVTLYLKDKNGHDNFVAHFSVRSPIEHLNERIADKRRGGPA